MRGQAAERRAQAKRPFSVGDSVEFEREDRVELGVVERTADGTVEVWFHGQRFRLSPSRLRKTARKYCPGF